MGRPRRIRILDEIAAPDTSRGDAQRKTQNKDEPALHARKRRRAAAASNASPGAGSEAGDASSAASGSAAGPSRGPQAVQKPGRARKRTKDPFRVLKGLSGPVEDALPLYASLAPSAYAARPRAAYIQGRRLRLDSKISNDTLTCRMLEQCINASAAGPSLLLLGLKGDMEPFNLFDFADGDSHIAILDHNLDTIDCLHFAHGTVVQLRIYEEPGFCRCTVLFHDGTLCRFDYNKDGIRSTPPLPENPDAYSNPRVANIVMLETTLKVTRFHELDGTLVYTDGFVVVVHSNGERRVSPAFRTLVVDLAVFLKDGTEHIFLLDRNGSHFYCRADLSGYVPAGSFPGFHRLVYISEYNLLLTTDGVTYKNFGEIAAVPCTLRKTCRYYLPTRDGSVTAYRLLNKDRRSRMLFRLASRNEGLVLCTEKPEFDMFGDSRMNIIEAASLGAYLLLVTEHGYLIRLNVE